MYSILFMSYMSMRKTLGRKALIIFLLALTPLQDTQGLIETLGSMVIFDENQAVSDINKYKFLYPIYAKVINFLVI